MRSIREFIEMIERRHPLTLDFLYKSYGENFSRKIKTYIDLLKRFGELFGYDSRVVLCRAPGRVNLMGRHIDYMGGHVNPIAVNFEIIAVIGRRNDDYVYLYNMDPCYSAKIFKIGDELPDSKIHNLEEWDKWTVEKFREKGGKYDWDDYVKGLIIYLQNYFMDDNGRFLKRIGGFNALIYGDIPPRRGLSSSSALVVAIALGLKKIYNLDIPLNEFIDIIGYSEWYRLTRGGTADHAAIILSKRGHVSHIGCLPTLIDEVDYAPFPKGYKIVIVDSGFKRPATDDATNYLRVTAASYRIGLLIVKSLYPQYSNKLKLLRDLNTRNLGVDLKKIYEILLRLPLKASRNDLRRIISEKYLEELESIFMNHREPAGGYKIRQNVLFGLAEEERAFIFPSLLKRNAVRKIIELINISHDGDRVVKFNKFGDKMKWDSSKLCSDQVLIKYISLLSRGVFSEELELYMQPGGYERSIEPIDFICDQVRYNLGEYAGAQISGAGLGGNVLIFIREDKVNLLEKVLMESYYDKYGVKIDIIELSSSQGASIFD